MFERIGFRARGYSELLVPTINFDEPLSLVSLAAVFLGCHATLHVTAQKTAARETTLSRAKSTESLALYQHIVDYIQIGPKQRLKFRDFVQTEIRKVPLNHAVIYLFFYFGKYYRK